MQTSPIATPDQLADNLERSYSEFQRAVSLLGEDEYESPCLSNGWTPKATVAHVAFWDDYQLRRMRAALAGEWAERRPRPSEDNDQRARSEDRPWEDVVAEADRNRERLVHFARSVRAEQISAVYEENGEAHPVLATLLPHMANHVEEHAAEILTYCGSTARWTRHDLLRLIKRQQKGLLDSIGSLSEQDLTTVPVSGDWTVRDVLAHELAWSEYVVEILRGWPDFVRADMAWWLDGDSLDTVNQRLHESSIHLPLIEVLDGLSTAYRRILRGVAACSEEELARVAEFGWRMDGSLSYLLYRMTLHTAEHAVEIWAARDRGVLQPVKV